MKMKRKIIMSVTRLGKRKHPIKCVASSFIIEHTLQSSHIWASPFFCMVQNQTMMKAE